MKKNILIFAIIISSIVLEISFLPNFFSSQHVPSLILIFVIFLSVWDESKNFWKWAFLAGILFDLLSFQLLGLHAFSFLAVSLFSRFISKRFLASQAGWNLLIISVLIFLGSWLSDWLIIVFVKLEYFFREGKYLEGLDFWNSGIFYRAFYGAVLGIFLYSSIKKAVAKFSKRPATLK
jgi:rod shape-determining protein MreD